MPFSGGRKRMSPGFSPLGGRAKKRMQEGGKAGEEPQAPGSVRRRLAQRSLLFGGPAEGEVSFRAGQGGD
jgi:hypothetical protein